jgi:hypothetical protein
MSIGDSRKPHFCDCGWNGHCDCALWITRAKGSSPYVRGFVRKDAAESSTHAAHLWPCAERRASGPPKHSISGHVRKEEAALGSRAEHLWPCAERRGRIGHESATSVALCGKTSIGRTKQSVSGHVRKDEAALGTKAAHLWPCAERRRPIGRESPASVALCGKTRAKTAGAGRGRIGTDRGQGPVRSRPRRSRDTGAGQLARGRTGSSQEVRTGSASRSWAATRGSYDVQARQRLAYSPRAATSSSWLPNSAIRPSMTTAIRSASCAVCRRWAMATTVRPSSRAAIDPSR